jgi:hypothetical protein
MNEDKKSLFLKFLSGEQEEDEKSTEFKTSSGYVGNVSQPYDRLKSRLRKMFGPTFPIICDKTSDDED